MRYSLSSRFRGTFLGTAIGEILGTSRAITTGFSYLNTIELGYKLGQCKPPFETKSLDARLAVVGAKNLIQLGRFDVDAWHNTFEPNSEDTINYHPTTAILATLPIALFYHENEIKLRQNLQLALGAVGQDDPVIRDGALAVGYAIAQSLKEKLNVATLIGQIIAFIGEPHQITQHLGQVQTLLEQQASLEQAVTQLSNEPSTPIALAFYCFLSTVEDFRLSLRRAVQTNQPQLTSAIVGALSGAYNSKSGIPINWQLRESDANLAAWGITAAEMLQLSDSLVAVWSGVYNQAIYPSDINAIAAPRVIRPR